MARSRKSVSTSTTIAWIPITDTLSAQLQDAVSAAHDTSVAFDEEVLREHRVFQAAKRTELRDLLLSLADGHIAHYEKAMGDMQRCQPHLESIRVN